MWNQFIHGLPDVLVLIFLFGFSIFIHELGHFLAARWCGLVIKTFSIGFGPALWKRTVGGIVYKIGMLPFGGYVALPQLDPSGMDKLQGKQEPGEESEAVEVEEQFPPVAAWKKIVVAVAGPCGNILLAIVLAWVIFMHPGGITAENNTDIGFVPTNSVAHAVGLRAGDRVLAVAGATVGTWDELLEEALLRRDEDGIVALAVERDGRTFTLDLTIPGPREGMPLGGVAPGYEVVMVRLAPDDHATRDGLQLGDVIRKLDGRRVVSRSHLESLMEGRDGETATLALEREGRALTLDVQLPFTGVGHNLAPLVGRTVPGSAAAAAGLRSGDEVLTYNGIIVTGRQHLSDLVQAHGGQEAELELLRGGERRMVLVTPRYEPEAERYLVGIEWAFDPGVPWMRYKRPWAQVRNDARGILRILRALVTPGEAGNAGAALGGPVMIFAALWAAIRVSLLNAVGFLRFLNVNLAMLNLLPLPILDGGHVVFALWEVVTRRKPHPRLVSILVNAFAILLLGTFLFLTVRDVDWLFPRIRQVLTGRGDGTEQVEPLDLPEE